MKAVLTIIACIVSINCNANFNDDVLIHHENIDDFLLLPVVY